MSISKKSSNTRKQRNWFNAPGPNSSNGPKNEEELKKSFSQLRQGSTRLFTKMNEFSRNLPRLDNYWNQ